MKANQPVLLDALSDYAALGDRERADLVAFLGKASRHEARADLLIEGEEGLHAYAIESGWAYSYKDMEDGRRQIVNFHIPGNTIGLRTLVLRTSDFSFGTVTDCTLYAMRQPDLQRLFDEHPRIATAFMWLLARDEAMVVEHLVSLGRRSADERLAHLLCEIGCRVVNRGLGEGGGFSCPLPQTMIADALGLSVVHLNRTLRKLKEQGLVTVQPGMLEVPDLRRLLAVSDFEADYLELGDGRDVPA